MSKEQTPKTALVQEVETYIHENYPVEKKYVDRLLNDLRSFAEVRPRSDVSSSDLESISKVAISDGIITISYYPIYRYLPLRLAALKEFEDERPENYRYLTPSEYVRLLAIGEFVTAKRGEDKKRFGKNYLNEHDKKAIKLMGFYGKLNK
jgi:uncharacterized membrane protein